MAGNFAMASESKVAVAVTRFYFSRISKAIILKCHSLDHCVSKLHLFKIFLYVVKQMSIYNATFKTSTNARLYIWRCHYRYFHCFLNNILWTTVRSKTFKREYFHGCQENSLLAGKTLLLILVLQIQVPGAKENFCGSLQNPWKFSSSNVLLCAVFWTLYTDQKYLMNC